MPFAKFKGDSGTTFVVYAPECDWLAVLGHAAAHPPVIIDEAGNQEELKPDFGRIEQGLNIRRASDGIR